MLQAYLASASTTNAPSHYHDDDPEADAEADAIIARLRRRRSHEAEEAAAAAAENAEVQAVVAARAGPWQGAWGHAARAAAERKVRKERKDEKAEALAAAARAAAAAAIGDLAERLLTQPDFLWLLQQRREEMCFRGEVTTDEELHEFSSIAAVCTAWRDATAEVLARRRVLVHVRQLPNPPPPPPQLEQVSFVEIAAGSGELLVAEAHRISVLAPPVSDNAWTQKRQLGSGGTEAGCLFYPRGLAVSACGRKVFVADRSNHRVQCLSMREGGSPIDCTPEGAVSCPYGLALWHGLLYIADANNDRIVVLSARQLQAPPVLTFGSSGSEKGELSAPRGIALWHSSSSTQAAGGPRSRRSSKEEPQPQQTPAAASSSSDAAAPLLLVTEYNNNRVSIFSLDGTFKRSFGDEVNTSGSLPLRKPYGVLHAHDLLLVTEFGGKRLIAFSATDGNYTPLQILQPPQCGALCGLACLGPFVLACDANRGRMHCFAAATALLGAAYHGNQTTGGVQSAAQRRYYGESASSCVSPSRLRRRISGDLKRAEEEEDNPPSPTTSIASSSLASSSSSSYAAAATSPSTPRSSVFGPLGGGDSTTQVVMENFSRDALGRFFRPTLADVRQRFKEGHMVTEAELDAISEENALRRSEEKAELRRLRDRRASDDPNVSKLTSDEEERLSKEDAETERIAKIAESLARTWGAEGEGSHVVDQYGRPRPGVVGRWDPYGRRG